MAKSVADLYLKGTILQKMVDETWSKTFLVLVVMIFHSTFLCSVVCIFNVEKYGNHTFPADESLSDVRFFSYEIVSRRVALAAAALDAVEACTSFVVVDKASLSLSS